MTQRLTMKLSGGGKLLTEHVDLEARVSEAEFRAEAKSLAERLGKRTAERPASAKRKRTSTRATVEVDV